MSFSLNIVVQLLGMLLAHGSLWFSTWLEDMVSQPYLGFFVVSVRFCSIILQFVFVDGLLELLLLVLELAWQHSLKEMMAKVPLGRHCWTASSFSGLDQMGYSCCKPRGLFFLAISFHFFLFSFEIMRFRCDKEEAPEVGWGGAGHHLMKLGGWSHLRLGFHPSLTLGHAGLD